MRLVSYVIDAKRCSSVGFFCENHAAKIKEKKILYISLTKNFILMKNKYLNFISDEHFLNCIANLHSAYIKAKNNISKKFFTVIK